MNTEIRDLPVADILIPKDRARDFDEDNAQALATLILAQGLFHPIRVREVQGTYHLISGRHRLRAFEINGTESIPATISDAASDEDARLEEVMENLGRSELIALDRCHHLYELKAIHDAAHPDASKPGRRVNGKSFPISDEAEVFGLASTIAEKVGLSKRAINIAVKIWTDLTPASRLRLIGTDLASKQTELKALSEQKPAMQTKILDLIQNDDHPDIKNVGGALAFLEGGVAISADERTYAKVRNAVAALPDASLDRLVAENVERLILSLKRQGLS